MGEWGVTRFEFFVVFTFVSMLVAVTVRRSWSTFVFGWAYIGTFDPLMRALIEYFEDRYSLALL